VAARPRAAAKLGIRKCKGSCRWHQEEALWHSVNGSSEGRGSRRGRRSTARRKEGRRCPTVEKRSPGALAFCKRKRRRRGAQQRETERVAIVEKRRIGVLQTGAERAPRSTAWQRAAAARGGESWRGRACNKESCIQPTTIQGFRVTRAEITVAAGPSKEESALRRESRKWNRVHEEKF
jgi:hypothetical protein